VKLFYIYIYISYLVVGCGIATALFIVVGNIYSVFSILDISQSVSSNICTREKRKKKAAFPFLCNKGLGLCRDVTTECRERRKRRKKHRATTTSLILIVVREALS
jgi:hypothetical protein